jgi:hypothetical protein
MAPIRTNSMPGSGARQLLNAHQARPVYYVKDRAMQRMFSAKLVGLVYSSSSV